MIKRVCLLDVDGVVADFSSAYLRAYMLCGGDPVTPAMVTEWEHEDCLPRGKELAPLVRQFIRAPGFALELEPYPGAIEAVSELQKIAHVYFVTAPYKKSRTWMSDRTEWLVEKFGADHDQVIHCKRKGLVQGDIFVDDLPANIDAWMHANPGKRAFCWAHPHNSGRTDLVRTNDWSEVIACCKL